MVENLYMMKFYFISLHTSCRWATAPPPRWKNTEASLTEVTPERLDRGLWAQLWWSFNTETRDEGNVYILQKRRPPASFPHSSLPHAFPRGYESPLYTSLYIRQSLHTLCSLDWWLHSCCPGISVCPTLQIFLVFINRLSLSESHVSSSLCRLCLGCISSSFLRKSPQGVILSRASMSEKALIPSSYLRGSLGGEVCQLQS